MKIPTLTIVGVGLIGASIGLAARRRGLASHILGVGRQAANLERAQTLGAIDAWALDMPAAVHRADVAVFCTPVDAIAGQVLEAAPGCKAEALLTDAGSTKAEIVKCVEERLPTHIAFVGGHPLAGSEKRGPDFADADLFQDRVTIVCQTSRTRAAALEQTAAFWEALGSRVRIMAPEEHDRSLAVTSHLPHLAAAALAAVLPRHLSDLTATGFRDTTRVAAGDPSLWTAILLQNRQPVLAALREFEACLIEFQAALETGTPAALAALLDRAKKVRDALGN
jgi:prephenate dehydrogenase